MWADFEDRMEELDVVVGFGALFGCLSDLLGALCCFLLLLHLPFLQILVNKSSWQVMTLCELIIIVYFHLQTIFLYKNLQLFLLLHINLCLLPLALQPTHVFNVL